MTTRLEGEALMEEFSSVSEFPWKKVRCVGCGHIWKTMEPDLDPSNWYCFICKPRSLWWIRPNIVYINIDT
jgi:hypothetical protein